MAHNFGFINDKLIVALDVSTEHEALNLVNELIDGCVTRTFKIGLELFVAQGPLLVRNIIHRGGRVFLDLKFHDIPNTVKKVSVAAMRTGAFMFSMHCLGGSAMMQQAAAEVRSIADTEGLRPPIMIGVTVLTSHDEDTMDELGILGDVSETVYRMALLAKESGLNGIVCSGEELPDIRQQFHKQFITVVPGIRMPGDSSDDQERIVTPEMAIAAGADYIVVGRSIANSNNIVAKGQQCIESMEKGWETHIQN